MLKKPLPDERNIVRTTLDVPVEFNIPAQGPSQPISLGNKVVTATSPSDDPLHQSIQESYYTGKQWQAVASRGQDIL